MVNYDIVTSIDTCCVSVHLVYTPVSSTRLVFFHLVAQITHLCRCRFPIPSVGIKIQAYACTLVVDLTRRPFSILEDRARVGSSHCLQSKCTTPVSSTYHISIDYFCNHLD
uniref:Uncharacterized protein n=1 Tax=Physcomitrium patens TaxID=3218 RepID=A0A7I3YVX9_PHYPA